MTRLVYLLFIHDTKVDGVRLMAERVIPNFLLIFTDYIKLFTEGSMDRQMDTPSWIREINAKTITQHEVIVWKTSNHTVN